MNISPQSQPLRSSSITDDAPSHARKVDERFETLVKSTEGRELTIRRDIVTGTVEVDCKRPPIRTMTFQGGGVKGVAYSAVLKVLQERQLLGDIRDINGTSAGALTAALVASGIEYAEFDNTLDKLDLVTLLDSKNKFVKTLQGLCSEMGNQIAMIPGKVGSIGKLLYDLGSRLGSRALPLETLIREKSVESIKAQYEKALENPKQKISDASKESYENIKARGYVTFADLATLNKDIPEIKQLHITGTGMFEGRPQLIVFSASESPEMDIAFAAHISSSLPFIFQSPTVKGQPFQDEDDRLRAVDGGVSDNSASSFLKHQFLNNKISEEEPLCFLFEAGQEGEKKDRGTLTSVISDWIIGAPYSARGAQEADRLKALEKYTVIVPLKTEKGDFTSFTNGTVKFDMSADIKNHLQEKLGIKLNAHLDERMRHPETFEFESLDEALLDLPDELFQEARVALKKEQTSPEIIIFRLHAQQMLTDLQNAVKAVHTTPLKWEKIDGGVNAIITLQKLGDTQAKIEWLVKRFNDNDVPEFIQLVHLAKNEAADQRSPLMTEAIKEMDRRNVTTKSINFINEVISPSLYRLDQPDSNVRLLNKAEADLRNTTSAEGYNAILNRIADQYVSRDFPNSSRPFKSTTVTQALAWRIPADR